MKTKRQELIQMAQEIYDAHKNGKRGNSKMSVAIPDGSVWNSKSQEYIPGVSILDRQRWRNSWIITVEAEDLLSALVQDLE